MKQYENIIIGFGKGGKTLAGALAASGQSAAIIEQSDKMYGGTCINVACIPTKSLEHSARLSAAQGGSFEEKAIRYEKAIQEKRRLTAMLREKNYQKAVSGGVDVLLGKARFQDKEHIVITKPDGEEEILRGKRFFINTGARPFIPPIPGIEGNPFVYTSETLMELDTLPEHLVIIGAGYIGLEFASYYANFGTQVTILQDKGRFMPREDAEVADTVLASFESRGIRLLPNASATQITQAENHAVVTVKTESGIQELTAQAVLVATGRRPNIQELHPENAGIELTSRGAVLTDNYLRTTNPDIWAMGDVAGGLQFTYISLDDSRIVKSQLLGSKERTTENRGEVPYSVFLDPPFSRVGLTEQQALDQGYQIKIARLPAAAIPKAQVLKKTTGLLKVIVDAQTNLILGAHIFCAESHEMIQLFKLAIDAKLPYTLLRDSIYTHPTMSESLNDLLAGI
jgi:pyruvate/2-oxoglutarate dehydrogenase complex dihydrolipoamide dehydrogenase (E3) component